MTPAVVNIATRGSEVVRESPMARDPFFRRFFSLPERIRCKPTSSLGSGVIIDANRGLLLTNHHVIEDADEIMVTCVTAGGFAQPWWAPMKIQTSR